jgi:3-oxoacyl-[acyl-carrier-protein] synthase-3
MNQDLPVLAMERKGGDDHGGQDRLIPRNRRPATVRRGRLPDIGARRAVPDSHAAVSLAHIAVWLPEEAIGIADLREHLGLTPAQVKVLTRVHGLREVRMSSHATLREGLLTVGAQALDALADLERVRYVLHAHTLTDVAPSTVNVVHEVCDALGVGHATAFSVTQQNCASGLLALDVAGKLLAADGDEDAVALLLMGEKPFTPLAQLLPNTSVMGEAAVACLLRRGGARDQLAAYHSRTRGQYSAGLELAGDSRMEFEREYADTLAVVIATAVAQADLTLDEVSIILPHNVNRSSWIRVARILGLDHDRLLLSNIPTLGHCYCADPFLNLVTAIEQRRLDRGDHYIMAVVGLGATFTAAVFRR